LAAVGRGSLGHGRCQGLRWSRRHALALSSVGLLAVSTPALASSTTPASARQRANAACRIAWSRNAALGPSVYAANGQIRADAVVQFPSADRSLRTLLATRTDATVDVASFEALRSVTTTYLSIERRLANGSRGGHVPRGLLGDYLYVTAAANRAARRAQLVWCWRSSALRPSVSLRMASLVFYADQIATLASASVGHRLTRRDVAGLADDARSLARLAAHRLDQAVPYAAWVGDTISVRNELLITRTVLLSGRAWIPGYLPVAVTLERAAAGG
jgi:hypothetical protein